VSSVDLTAVNTNLSDVSTKIGTPAGASVSADLVTAATALSALSTKIGTPAGASVVADIAAVPAAAATTLVNTVLEAGYTVGDILKLLAAIGLGNATVPESDGSYTFTGLDGTTVRVQGSKSGDIRTITTLNAD